MAKTKTEQPTERFCYVCEMWVLSTEKEFNGKGHVSDHDSAMRRYHMTELQLEKIDHKRVSGAYSRRV